MPVELWLEFSPCYCNLSRVPYSLTLFSCSVDGWLRLLYERTLGRGLHQVPLIHSTCYLDSSPSARSACQISYELQEACLQITHLQEIVPLLVLSVFQNMVEQALRCQACLGFWNLVIWRSTLTGAAGMQRPVQGDTLGHAGAAEPTPVQQAWPGQRPGQESPQAPVRTNRETAPEAEVPQAQEQEKQAMPLPKVKPVVTEIQLADEVTIRQLAQQLDVPAAQVEQALVELGERPCSYEDSLSPENAELAAMSFGKTVVFSQAFLVSPAATVQQ